MAALDAAVAFAEASPFPLPEQATDDVFAATLSRGGGGRGGNAPEARERDARADV